MNRTRGELSLLAVLVLAGALGWARAFAAGPTVPTGGTTAMLDVALLGSDSLSGVIPSTGTTRATLVPAVTGSMPIAYGFFVNTDTATRNVIVSSARSGHVVRKFQLAAGPSGFAIDSPQYMHGEGDEALVYTTDSGCTLVYFVGNTISRRYAP